MTARCQCGVGRARRDIVELDPAAAAGALLFDANRGEYLRISAEKVPGDAACELHSQGRKVFHFGKTLTNNVSAENSK